MKKRKWIAYGVTGAVGVGIVAGGATVAANAMEIRNAEGTPLPAAAITHDGASADNGSIDTGKVELRHTGTSVSVVTPPSATTAPTPNTPQTPVSQPSPPSPVTPPSPVSVPSPVSPASSGTVASAPSR